MLGKDLGNGTPKKVSKSSTCGGQATNSAWEDRFVVNVALNPGHQMFDVGWRWHFGRAFVVLRILPEVFEPSNVRESAI